MSTSTPSAKPRTGLGATWLLLGVAALISLGLVAFWIVPVVLHPRPRAHGDGRTVASYGFDLRGLAVPADLLVAGGVSKDGLPALTAPPVLAGREVEALRAGGSRGMFAGGRPLPPKVLRPGDPVIGVVVEGEARAYPVRMLAWHEVVNDRVGGRDIAVTYSPLGDAAVVFDRRVGNEVLTFGVTGLLYNSNTLVYDRRDGGRGESLWSPLLGRAIAGPAVGATLEVLPAQLTQWQRWLERFPATTVLDPDPRWATRYKKEPYSSYFGSDQLRFPVRPLPPPGGPSLKAPAVLLAANGDERVVVLTEARSRGTDGVFETTVGGRAVRLHIEGEPPRAFVEALDGGPLPVRAHAAWFTAYAFSQPGGTHP